MKFHRDKDHMGNNGFSLLEVMIALVVFTISFLGFYNLQLNSVNSNAKARRLTDSAVSSSDLIERLVGLDYDDPLLNDDDLDGEAGLNDITSPDGTMTSDDGLYTISWNVSVDMPIVNVKHIRVITGAGGGVDSKQKTIFEYYKSNKF
ncbi:MAG: prepilin-type N-terminal cleavage/methylation domain-containing protein [Desulfobulbaceae bacterium]|nr:prepilin-type N-terminal cleavage/methylation domain-containing protein [Desulfobulbaceae bacterium]